MGSTGVGVLYRRVWMEEQREGKPLKGFAWGWQRWKGSYCTSCFLVGFFFFFFFWWKVVKKKKKKLKIWNYPCDHPSTTISHKTCSMVGHGCWHPSYIREIDIDKHMQYASLLDGCSPWDGRHLGCTISCMLCRACTVLMNLTIFWDRWISPSSIIDDIHFWQTLI